jgi:hypothetical protein
MAPQQKLRDLEQILPGFPGKVGEVKASLLTKAAALKRVSQQPAVFIAHEGGAMLRKKRCHQSRAPVRLEKRHAITIPSSDGGFSSSR